MLISKIRVFAGLVAILVLGLTFLSGCAHRQLARNTALTATTVTSIHYRMVLDNIAMMSCHPEGIPAHLRLGDGTVQISNQLGFGEAGGFSILDHAPFGFEQWGPGGSTKLSEQWGTDAVGDPLQLVALQTIYRKAFGLPPVPTPNFIRQAQEQAAANSGSSSGDNSDSDDSDSDDSDSDDNSDGNGSSNGEDASNDASNQQLDAAEFDIPQGWFHIGERKDVPKDASYVGRYQQRYVWVDCHGMEGLAQFTLAVLTIIKSASDESLGRGGLMVTP